MNFNSIELKFIFLPPIRWLSLYFYLYLSISLSLSISRFPLLFHSLPLSRCVSVCVFSNFLPVVQIGVLSSSLLSLSYCITSRLFVKIQLIVAKLLHIPFSLHSISFWDNMHIHSIKPGHLKFIEFPCTMLCVSFHNVHVKHSYKWQINRTEPNQLTFTIINNQIILFIFILRIQLMCYHFTIKLSKQNS